MKSYLQKYHLKWPLTPAQLVNIDEMFGEIYGNLGLVSKDVTTLEVTTDELSKEVGPIGYPGRDGSDGADGFQGIQGPIGKTGVDGRLGYPGLDGDDGRDGWPGLQGSVGPVGPQGIMGMQGQDGEDANEWPILAPPNESQLALAFVPYIGATADVDLGAKNFATTGSIGVTGSRVLKGWFTDLEVTNDIVGDITGVAAKATILETTRAIYGNNFDGSAALTGIIASTYGGTGNGFTKFTGPTTAEKEFTLPDASAVILTDNADVTVAQGGTGTNTFTAYSVICAGTTATGAFQNVVGLGNAGEVLTSAGAAALPAWVALGAWVAHDVLSATHGDTLAAGVSQGSLIYGNATPKWAELVLSANSVLVSDATDVKWATTLPTGVQDNITRLGTLIAGATGAGFTVALTTSTITGTLADARLSANVPLLNANNIFSGITNRIQVGAAGAVDFLVRNTTSGAAATATQSMYAGTSTCTFYAFSQGYTTSGWAIADSGALRAGGAGGLSLVTGNGSIQLYPNQVLQLLLSTAGLLQLSAYGAGTATFDASGNITSVSDERFKDRISPLPYGLTEVLQLEPVQHGYNDLSGLEREHLYGGFIAQQVQPFMPLAVGIDQRGYLTLADRPILGAVVNSIKTHETRLKALEERIH